MFQRSRPTSIVPIDADLARRLSVVQEIPSPTHLAVPRAISRQPTKTRPLSEVTEIFDDDESEASYEDDHLEDVEELDNEDDESEFEEDSEGSSGEFPYGIEVVSTCTDGSR
jgi:hypothetical protein